MGPATFDGLLFKNPNLNSWPLPTLSVFDDAKWGALRSFRACPPLKYIFLDLVDGGDYKGDGMGADRDGSAGHSGVEPRARQGLLYSGHSQVLSQVSVVFYGIEVFFVLSFLNKIERNWLLFKFVYSDVNILFRFCLRSRTNDLLLAAFLFAWRFGKSA